MKNIDGKSQIGRRKRSHDVSEAIERLISQGEYAVGEQLPSEKDLMTRFGVGRPAVREALFFLEQQGLVETRSGARAHVSTPSARIIIQQLTDISKRLFQRSGGHEQVTEARLMLEAGLAWLAAQKATDEDLARLKAALDANVAAVGNTFEFIRTDVAFHFELAVISKNPIFSTIQEVLVEWLVDQRTTTLHMPDADRLSVRDHTAVYEAVAARDPARAYHEMASHIRLVAQLYTEAKRISETILRGVTHDVANRFEREKDELWAQNSLNQSSKKPRKPRSSDSSG
ncbi:MAG: FCD domain-containing protein [Devosia sp.]